MKRVLLPFSAFHGPGMGHTRLLRIFRSLPRFGWEPVLLTEPCRNDAFRGLIPADRLIEAEYLDLQQLYARLRNRGAAQASGPSTGGAKAPTSRAIGMTSFINRWFLVPDKQILWAGPARRAIRTAKAGNFDAVFASNLPATNSVTGARIARDLGVPLVVEYRDLWNGNPYHNLTPATPLHAALHRRMERRVLETAARVTCLSTGIGERLQQIHPGLFRQPPQVCYNFFDPAEFAAAGPAPAKPEAFTISYVGTMYLSRNPGMFFQGLRQFIDRNGIEPARFRFRWLGAIVGIADLQRMIDEAGVAPYIDFLGQIPHRDALNELRRSHVSLIIQSPDDAIHIPGKMFEAMGARVPLLAVANPCEVTNIIDRTRAGLHSPYETAAVAASIDRLWQHAQSGAAWNYDEAQVARFSIDGAVAELAGILDAAVKPG